MKQDKKDMKRGKIKQDKEDIKQDILNREEFVSRVYSIIEGITQSNIDSNVSFAINGEWGCGKSFVLDMLANELSTVQSEETAENKYFIIRYNCWQYDFYDEPIIAIVAAILSSIQEQTNNINSQVSTTVQTALFVAKETILRIGKGILKEKFGVDVAEINSKAQEFAGMIAEANEKSQEDIIIQNDFDELFSFKAKLEKLKKALRNLTEVYSIVFIVDELDRCIPAYSIKVLERLHHITEGISKIITVLAIDENHLQYGVKQVFGETDSSIYLQKFIQFNLNLDTGKRTKGSFKYYSEYSTFFENGAYKFNQQDVDDFVSEILQHYPIRTQEQIMRRVIMAHKMSDIPQQYDYSFMCMEILLGVMQSVYKHSLNTDFKISEKQYYSKDNVLNSIELTSFSTEGTDGVRYNNYVRNFRYPFGRFLYNKFLAIGLEEDSLYRPGFQIAFNAQDFYQTIFLQWIELHPTGTRPFNLRVYSDEKGSMNVDNEIKTRLGYLHKFSEILELLQ